MIQLACQGRLQVPCFSNDRPGARRFAWHQTRRWGSKRWVWISCFHLREALLSFSLVSWFVPPAFPIPWVVKFPLTSQGFQSGASLCLLSPVFHSVHSPMPGNCQGERWPPLNQLACFPLPHSSSLLPPVPFTGTCPTHQGPQTSWTNCVL